MRRYFMEYEKLNNKIRKETKFHIVPRGVYVARILIAVKFVKILMKSRVIKRGCQP